MYEARKICNFLLANFDPVELDLTNLRINKLLFFIHGEGLQLRPEGLVRNHFEAWQFGPVIRPVFDTFKIYKDGPIKAPALYLDYASGKQLPVPFHDIAAADRDLILRVFKNYSRFTTGQLVALSHERGGPWDIVYQRTLADSTQSPRIPNDLIRKHFGGDKAAVRH